jgi:short-subunit dehydrogenase
MTTKQAQPSNTPFRRRYGSWAVVTGASSGIGEAFAKSLAARGMNLVLVARRDDLLRSLAETLRASSKVEIRCLPLDLSNHDAHESLTKATDSLDVGLLIAAAGFGSSGPFINADLSTERNMVDVNCRAVMSQALHFGRRFAQQKRGGMVLMSSLVAFQGVPYAAHYAATKAYVQSLAEGLHHELAAHGVDVLACAPGPIHSGFAGRANLKLGFAQTPADVADATLNSFGKRTTCRPGWLAKALELSLKTLPRFGRVRMMSVVMKGMANRSDSTATVN